MNDRRQPWMKWYPADWSANPELRMCSMAARGLWAYMLSIMHSAEPYGHLLVRGKILSAQNLAYQVGAAVGDVTKWLRELKDAEVFSITADGVPYSRRMVRDKAKADRDRENGKGGGNPQLRDEDNEGVNPPDNGLDKAQ